MSIRCTENAAQLREDLLRLQNWERKWMMEFHPKKCQVLNIITKRTPKTAIGIPLKSWVLQTTLKSISIRT
jgi:hypothetical protein